MDNYFNILGIDPGKNLGLSILSIDVNTYKILNSTTLTFKLDREEDDMLTRLTTLNNIITNIQAIYKPIACGYETPFMNSKFPKAVGQLSQYVSIIELTLRTNNPFIKIFSYAPKYVKAAFFNNNGISGNANKDDMLSNLLTIKELVAVTSPDMMTEHEVDATAIAYIVLQNIRYDHCLLLTV